MEEDIEALDWMTPATKKRALEKLRSVVNKIGYPDRWRDYSKSRSKRGDYFGNVERAKLFETRRQLAKIGKPVDRSEWYMTPPTVNAYYNPQMNDINFAAGVLQPPLYDPTMDDAPNYGNTGATIGHELTHGFDDEGRKFDAKGNLKDWWTAKDDEAFSRARPVHRRPVRPVHRRRRHQDQQQADAGRGRRRPRGLIWLGWPGRSRQRARTWNRVTASRPSSDSSSATRSGLAKTLARKINAFWR